jgi:hypothetical protein
MATSREHGSEPSGSINGVECPEKLNSFSRMTLLHGVSWNNTMIADIHHWTLPSTSSIQLLSQVSSLILLLHRPVL